MDMTTRMANRRCPDCDALQPLYVSKPGSKRVWQRGAKDVIDCPDCGVPLRLEANPRDPQGIGAAVVMGVAMCAALFGAIRLAAAQGLGAWGLGAILLGVVVAGTVLSMLWNGRSARARRVVKASGQTETREETE